MADTIKAAPGAVRERRVFSEDFKKKVIAEALENGHNKTARKHGINTSLLYIWKKRAGVVHSRPSPAITLVDERSAPFKGEEHRTLSQEDVKVVLVRAEKLLNALGAENFRKFVESTIHAVR